MSPISAGKGVGEQFGDAGDGHQQLRALVRARERPQLALERRELAVEVVDDTEQRLDRVNPDRGDQICLRHGPALTTCHAHLQAVLVRLEDPVRTGQVFGLVGAPAAASAITCTSRSG